MLKLLVLYNGGHDAGGMQHIMAGEKTVQANLSNRWSLDTDLICNWHYLTRAYVVYIERDTRRTAPASETLFLFIYLSVLD